MSKTDIKWINLFKLKKSDFELLSSPEEWDNVVDKFNLPSSKCLIKKFGSWNKAKLSFNFICILNMHRQHITTMDQWNKYAKEQRLPYAQTIIKYLGSWNSIKQNLQLEQLRSTYTKNHIRKIVLNHKKQITSKLAWDKYAAENHLPTYKTITKFFSWKEVKQLAMSKDISVLSNKELIDLAYKHKEDFTTMTHWNNYAAEHGLPYSMVYYRRFGTWNNAKAKIFE